MYRLELCLTEEDAKAFLVVAESIGGSPSKTPRGTFNLLGTKLRGAGVDLTHLSFIKDGNIYFDPVEVGVIATSKITCKKIGTK